MYQLKECNIDDFFQVPFNVYPKESNYISPLKSDLKRFLDGKKNPLFKHFGKFTYYTISKNGIPIGRIVAHIHIASNERHSIKRSYFGFFDCANDEYAAKTLLDKAEEFGRLNGMNEIMGKFNLTAMQQQGVLTGGYEFAPFTDQMYNPHYLPELLEANGYIKTFPSTTFEIDLKKYNPDTTISSDRVAGLKEAGYVWKQITKKDFKRIMLETCEILNKGFDKNPMFVPLTEEEFMFQAQEMIYIIDERISSIVYKDSQPVGVLVCIPDINPLLRSIKSKVGITAPFQFLKYRMNRKNAIIIFSSVLPEHHGNGLAPAMLNESTKNLKTAGYERLGITWVGDENKASLRAVEKSGAVKRHRLHLYKKEL